MRPHEKLDVWKKSLDFVVALYKTTEKFPKESLRASLDEIGRMLTGLCQHLEKRGR
jgi:hypothetical protein